MHLAQLRGADYPAQAYLVAPNHFVVLLGKTEGGYAVYDAHGRRKTYRASALEGRWSGNVLTMARREVRRGNSREEAPCPPARPGRIARHVASQPRVRFESLLADVGTVYVGQKGTMAEFRVRNAGGEPLQLWPADARSAEARSEDRR